MTLAEMLKMLVETAKDVERALVDLEDIENLEAKSTKLLNILESDSIPEEIYQVLNSKSTKW